MTDLTNWTDEDLRYEICDMAHELINFPQSTIGYHSVDIERVYVDEIEPLILRLTPFLQEFRRRHPVRDEFDESARGKYI